MPLTAEEIKQIRITQNLTQQDFADQLGITRELLNKVESGKRSVSKATELLVKDFVKTKESEQVSHETNSVNEYDHSDSYAPKTKTATSNKHQDQSLTENQNLYMRIMKKFEKFQPIPVFDVDIAASNLELYDDKSAIPEDFYYIPEFSGCRAFNVYSDSMEPLIPKGSRIFARKIDDWQMVLEFGQVYAVGLNDGRRFIKYIKRADDKTNFKLVSENDFYDDFDVPKDKIRSVWLIDGWMNKHTQSTFFVLKQPTAKK